MKLQQKLESSLDDIIKVSKKKPNIAQKSKGITRAGLNKLKRLKNQRPKSQRPQNNPQKTQEKAQKAPQNRQNEKIQQKLKNSGSKPSNRSGDFPAKKKWTAPRGRGGRFNRNFRGRGRN